jgi:hypothetical protein
MTERTRAVRRDQIGFLNRRVSQPEPRARGLMIGMLGCWIGACALALVYVLN